MRPLVLFVAMIIASGIVHAIPTTSDQTGIPRSGSNSLTEEDLLSARSMWKQPDASTRIEPDVLHELGRAFYRDGKIIEAKDAWRSAAKRDPNLPSAELMISLEKLYALIIGGDQEKAGELLKEIDTKFASDPHFYLVRGEQALRSRNIDAASDAFKKAYQLGPTLYITSLAYARIYDFQGEHPDARKFYIEATERAPRKGRVWEYLGSHEFRGGDHDAALKSFKRARKLDVRLPPAEAKMAKLSADAKDSIGARYWYRAALDTADQGQYQLRMSLINVLLDLRLLEEARVEIELLLQTGGKSSLLSTLGYIAEEQGDIDGAFKHYRSALEVNANDMVAHNNMSMLMIKTGRTPDQALNLAQTAYKASPDSALVLGTYACALQNAGKQSEAGKILPRAVQLNLRDAWIRYCYGKYLYDAGMRKKAQIHLEGAILLDADFPRKTEINRLITK